MKKKFILFLRLCFFLCVIVFVFAFLYLRGYRINFSDSLPYRVFKIRTAFEESIPRGDYVVVDYLLLSDNPVIEMGLSRKYLSRFPMVKQVGAGAGDSISLHDGHLYVNDVDFGLMTVLSADSHGNSLYPFPTPVVLQAGQYWLISEPARGFDSRYFGWIDRKSITYIAKPVF